MNTILIPFNFRYGHQFEFFYKPSKIYEYNFNSIQFQIWTSINGLTPIYIDDLEFLMELCLMHNDRRVTI